MKMRPFLAAVIAVFVFVFFYEWLFHGVLMHELYMKTPHLWRNQADMQSKFMWLVAGQALFSIMLTFIFAQGYQNRGLAEGLRFGLYFALLFSGPNLIMYAVAPYPGQMIICWIAGTFVELIAIGTILGLIFNRIK